MITAVRNTLNKATGNKIFQPNAISLSYLSRGNVARTQMMTNRRTTNL